MPATTTQALFPEARSERPRCAEQFTRRTRPLKGLTVWHVVSSLMYGGGQRVAVDLVRRLGREPGLQTRLVLIGETTADGFGHVNVPMTHVRAYDGRYNRPLSLMRAALALRRRLTSESIDILHTHGWDCDVIAGFARTGLPMRHVVHQHIVADWASSPRTAHRVRREVTRLALGRRGTTWVSVSAAVKRSLEGLTWLNPDRVQVVWNGVDLEQFRPTAVPRRNAVPVIGVAARSLP